MAARRARIRRPRTAPLVAIAALAAFTVAAPAAAARPTREIVDVGTPEIEALIAQNLSDVCGFEIAVDADARITIMVFRDGAREIDTSQIKWTLTNVATGASIRVHNVGPDIFWVNRDGATMHAIMGRSEVVHDGVGLIGRVVINETSGEVLQVSGRVTGDIAQMVCEPLA